MRRSEAQLRRPFQRQLWTFLDIEDGIFHSGHMDTHDDIVPFAAPQATVFAKAEDLAKAIVEHDANCRSGAIWIVLPEPCDGACAHHHPPSIDSDVIAVDHSVRRENVFRRRCLSHRKPLLSKCEPVRIQGLTVFIISYKNYSVNITIFLHLCYTT